ncbi:MAG: adenosylcobalamin-dependent ribonucleoside-diphosphate reductase [Bacteroidia bacterium]|nr:adenosylcobalamin-dependent ribonucleoside-diphosphate reductase [Bacteroidia bacterium]
MPVRPASKTFYNRDEVLKACLLYFENDELAATTWMNKYALKDKAGNFLELTPAEMHKRLAKEFARIEKNYPSADGNKKNLSDYGRSRQPLTEEKIFNLFDRFRYVIPQGSVMASLGNKNVLASLSNCVVLPEIQDSYGGIFFTDQQLAQLFKRRCGVGIDLSTIRPSGMRVSNAAGTTSGAVSFMERFSNTTREVAQHGRRGALMITMDVAHPDIEQFVTIKQDLTKVTGANVSVRISDEFMNAVVTNREFHLRFPIDSPNPTITKKINARQLWNTIIECAHRTAEPGIIFWDRQHRYSTSSIYPGYHNVSTNPCSEIAMQGGDSCRLIAINLLSFVEHPFTAEASFNHEKFYEVTYEAQRLMDDLVDLELEAIERILAKIKSDPEPDYIKDNELRTWKLLYETGKKGRRTGLGFTALADTLAALSMKFDSHEAIEYVKHIMQTKCKAEFESSVDMAIERGSFEDFNPDIEKESEFIQMLEKEFPDVHQRMMKYGRRNISISTVAPTGTLSILTQTSSGIEPVFMLSYTRRRKVNPDDKTARIDFTDALGDTWQEFTVYHHGVKRWMQISGIDTIEQSPYYNATANDIAWDKRVEMQAAVQHYTTHSISSTINLPAEASTEQVSSIYLEAWRKGLKGITVYREGSRSGVLVAGSSKPEKTEAAVRETMPPKRPKILEAEVVRFMNNEEKWIAVVGLLDGRPYEIFTGRAEDAFSFPSWVNKGWVIKNLNGNGKKRYDFQYEDKDGYRVTIEGLSRSFNPEYWNYAKLISGVLRHGMPLPQVVHLIENLHFTNDTINSWRSGVERTLKKFIPDGTEAADKRCPECNDPEGLVYEEGCLKCRSCGHSKCG